MTMRLRCLRVWGSSLAVSLTALCLSAEGQSSLAEVKARYPVTIEAIDSEILVGEPLVLRITYGNRSDSDMRVAASHRYADRLRSKRDFSVTDPAGMTLAKWHTLAHMIGEDVQVPPGEDYVIYQILYSVGNEGEFAWPKAGIYAARMLPEDMEYPEVRFTVLEPSRRDADAVTMWKEHIGLTGLDEEARHALGARLMEDYPDTVYGQWTIFRHADLDTVHNELWSEHRKRSDPSTPEGPEIVADYEAVHALAVATVTERLRYLIEDCPEFPLKDECMMRLAKALPDKADRAAQYRAIVQDYPDSPAGYLAAEELAKP